MHSKEDPAQLKVNKQNFLKIFLKERLGYMTPEIQTHKEKLKTSKDTTYNGILKINQITKNKSGIEV